MPRRLIGRAIQVFVKTIGIVIKPHVWLDIAHGSAGMLHRTIRGSVLRPTAGSIRRREGMQMNLAQTMRFRSGEPQPIPHPISHIGSYFRRLYAAWTTRRRRARDVAVLAGFSDRELWDIGLGRSDLMAIRTGHYRRNS